MVWFPTLAFLACLGHCHIGHVSTSHRGRVVTDFTAPAVCFKELDLVSRIIGNFNMICDLDKNMKYCYFMYPPHPFYKKALEPLLTGT